MVNNSYLEEVVQCRITFIMITAARLKRHAIADLSSVFKGFYTNRIMKYLGILFGLAVVLLMLSSCAAAPPSKGQPYETRLYVGKYEDVWLAALRALADYPLKISNKDVGKIYTEVINGPYNDLLFEYPDAMELPERFRYSVKLNFAKLVSEENKPVIRIRIIKDLERYRDFYTGWTAYPSDNLEEKVILYRVEHLLRMHQKLSEMES